VQSLDATYAGHDSYVNNMAVTVTESTHSTLSEEQKDQVEQTAQEFSLTEDEVMEQYRIMESFHSTSNNGPNPTMSPTFGGDYDATRSKAPVGETHHHPDNADEQSVATVGFGERALLQPKKEHDGVPAGPPRKTIILPAEPPLHYRVAGEMHLRNVSNGTLPNDDPPATAGPNNNTLTTAGIPPPPPYEAVPPRRLPSRSSNPMKLPAPGSVRVCNDVENIASVPPLCLSNPLYEDEVGVLSIPCDACHENMVVPKEAILATCHQCRHVRPASLTASY
jgi:hypothetical protein